MLLLIVASSAFSIRRYNQFRTKCNDIIPPIAGFIAIVFAIIMTPTGEQFIHPAGVDTMRIFYFQTCLYRDLMKEPTTINLDDFRKDQREASASEQKDASFCQVARRKRMNPPSVSRLISPLPSSSSRFPRVSEIIRKSSNALPEGNNLLMSS